MKIISIVLTALFLIVTILGFSSFQMWHLIDNSPKINKAVIYSLEKRLLIFSFIYLTFFSLSTFLTIKKMYLMNCILFVCFIVFSIVSSMIIYA